MIKLNAKQLRVRKPTEDEAQLVKRNPIYIVLDNVLDTYNIGAIFRIAEATAVQELILCGGSETPPSSRIHKAAVGTEEWVPWRYFSSAKEAVETLKKEMPDVRVVAVEQDPNSKSFFEWKPEVSESKPIVLIVGHETDGVSRETLDVCDEIVEMPMYGVNISMNVMVSTGIVVYKVLEMYNFSK